MHGLEVPSKDVETRTTFIIADIIAKTVSLKGNRKTRLFGPIPWPLIEFLVPMASEFGFPLIIGQSERFGGFQPTPLLDFIGSSNKLDGGYWLVMLMPPSLEGPHRQKDTSIADEQKKRKPG